MVRAVGFLSLRPLFRGCRTDLADGFVLQQGQPRSPSGVQVLGRDDEYAASMTHTEIIAIACELLHAIAMAPERCNVVGVLSVSGDRSRRASCATLHRTGFWSSSIQKKMPSKRTKSNASVSLINGMSWSLCGGDVGNNSHGFFQREDFRVRVRDFLVTSTAASAASLASRRDLNCMVLSRTATASASYSVLACTPSCASAAFECCFGPIAGLTGTVTQGFTPFHGPKAHGTQRRIVTATLG